MSARVLVLYAHPDPERSRVGRVLAGRLQGLDGVRVHDLYETYPDLFINRSREQALLLEADLIVFQHPMYWYSTPAILKEWQDVVLERGWAYGDGGTKLRGKDFMIATTTGGPASSYATAGLNQFSMEELLRPLEATARLCGMNYRPPFLVQGTRSMAEGDADRHADRYRALLADYVRLGSSLFGKEGPA